LVLHVGAQSPFPSTSFTSGSPTIGMPSAKQVQKVVPASLTVGRPAIGTTPVHLYARTESVTIDLFNVLPITQRKQIAIVAWGTTLQEDIQPRDFIIDADTGQAQPQAVAMQEVRYCNLDMVPGVEAASPHI
jgi:hypothetical protein